MPEQDHPPTEQGLPEKPGLSTAFPATDYTQWKSVAESFLNGAPFEKKLVAKTPEGIAVQPLYTREVMAGNLEATGLPGQSPYLRGTNPLGYKSAPWKFCQELTEGIPAEHNKVLHNNLYRGQTAVYVLLDKAGLNGLDPDDADAVSVGACGVSICDIHDLSALLDGIDLKAAPILLPAGASPFAMAALFAAHCEAQGVDPGTLEGALTGDPLSTLLIEGHLPAPISESLDDLSGWAKWAAVKAPGLKTVGVNGTIWYEAGGSAVEELAFSMATAVQYLKDMIDRGIKIDTVAPRMQFSFALGPQFFMEIAKLRAARVLWARIVDAFGGNGASQKIAMHTRTGLRNKTVFDPYVNMLRTTTEALSGVLGGTDSMHIGPFDEVVHTPTRFSHRIARNTHTLLAEEFNFCETADPAGGSWYIEALTDQLARAAWSAFQEIEMLGGMTQAILAGKPQAVIASKAKAARTAVDLRRTTLLGTNLYPNLNEKPLDGDLPDYAAIAAKRAAVVKERRDKSRHDQLGAELQEIPAWSDRFEIAVQAAAEGATLGQLYRAVHPGNNGTVHAEALNFRRAAQDFEDLRKATGAYAKENGGRPKVFLAQMGPIPQHKARADFSSGFFQTAGFECLDKARFQTAGDAADAFLASEAKIAVLCSTDPTYPELVPAFASAVKSKDPGRCLVLAGHPGDQEAAYRDAGIDEFIHIRSDVRQTLIGMLQTVGVALAAKD